MANVKESEKKIERSFAPKVEKLGGRAIKFLSPWFTGMPDRLIVMPGGRVYFAEFKTTGEDLKPRQKVVIHWLRRLGFRVWVIDTTAGANELLKIIQDEMDS